MNKTLSLALIVIGIVLLVLGVIASDSISSHISRFFTGEFTDRTVWLLLGGGVSLVVGLGSLSRSER